MIKESDDADDAGPGRSQNHLGGLVVRVIVKKFILILFQRSGRQLTILLRNVNNAENSTASATYCLEKTATICTE